MITPEGSIVRKFRLVNPRNPLNPLVENAVQISRGCPHTRRFCATHAMYAGRRAAAGGPLEPPRLSKTRRGERGAVRE